MFYISISNGLLSKEHRARMGSAVWEFMWCIDKVTMIVKGGTGIVLGGKPINLKDLADALGVAEMTVSRNLHRLQDENYIVLKHTPYGIIIHVLKAKKRFNKNVEAPNRNVEPPNENVEPNKTISVDSTVDNTVTKVTTPPKSTKKDSDPISLEEFVSSCRKSPQKHIQVIGEWAEAEKPSNTTRGEWKAFLDRNLRPARALAPYEISKIEKAYNLMLKDVVRYVNGKKVGFITKYTLETIGKYIDLV